MSVTVLGTKSVWKAASIKFKFATPVDRLAQVGVTMVRHHPPCVYHLST